MRKAIDGLLDSGPHRDARAADFMNDQGELNLDFSATPAEDAVTGLLFVVRAALDHAQMVATALVDERASFGVVTLTRGCLEGFAKAWWLADADDQRELVLRWLVLRSRELKFRLRIADDATWTSNLTGEELPLSELSAAIDRDVAVLSGGSGYEAPSNTALSCAFGDELGGSGRERYSLLSAVAHGESLGIEDFYGITTGTRRPHIVFGIPAWLSEYCAETSFVSASLASRRVLQLVGHARIAEDVAVAHDVALEVMKRERRRNAPVTSRSYWRFGSKSEA